MVRLWGAPLTSAMTPDQAIKVLQSSRDLPAITKALKIAILTPSTRPVAVAYLDGPSHFGEFYKQFAIGQLRISTAIFDDPKSWEQWKTNHSAEITKMENDWHQIVGTSFGDMLFFFGHNSDPAVFETFKHFVEGGFKAKFMYTADICDEFAAELKQMPGSPLEPLFLDYVEYLMSDIDSIGYDLPDTGYIPAGVFNIRTNVFRSYLSPEDLVAAKFGREDKGNILGVRGPEIIYKIGTVSARASLLKITASGKYSHQGVMELLSLDCVMNRYDPETVPLYMAALKTFDVNQVYALVRYFFAQDLNGSEGPSPPDLGKADPSIYPQVLRFISYAAKINVPDHAEFMMQYLKDAKTSILIRYHLLGQTPPTDAEIEAIPLIPPLPVETNSARPAKIPPKAENSASKSGGPTSASISLPLYIFGGIAAVAGVIFLFRHK